MLLKSNGYSTLPLGLRSTLFRARMSRLPIRTKKKAALLVVPIVFDLLAITTVALRVLARRVPNRRLDASELHDVCGPRVCHCLCWRVGLRPFLGVSMHSAEIESLYGAAPGTKYFKVWPFEAVTGATQSTTNSCWPPCLVSDDNSQSVPVGSVRLLAESLGSIAV